MPPRSSQGPISIPLSGSTFCFAGCSYSEGGLYTDASSPIKDAHLQIQSGVLAYARALDVWGKSGKIDVILPYSHLSGKAMVDGQPRERIVSGLNGPRIRFGKDYKMGGIVWQYRWGSGL
jgi:hypothetical protein